MVLNTQSYMWMDGWDGMDGIGSLNVPVIWAPYGANNKDTGKEQWKNNNIDVRLGGITPTSLAPPWANLSQIAMDIPSRTDSGQTKFRGENILVTAICIFHITRLLWGNLDESKKQSVDGEDVGDDADDVDDNAVAHK